MKMHTLQKVYESLRDDKFEIKLDAEIIKKAVMPIHRMLELSNWFDFYPGNLLF